MKRNICLLILIMSGFCLAGNVSTGLVGFGNWNYDSSETKFYNLPGLIFYNYPGFELRIEYISIDETGTNLLEQAPFEIYNASGTLVADGYLASGDFSLLDTSITMYSGDESDFIISNVYPDGSGFVASLDDDNFGVNLSLMRFNGNISADGSASGTFAGTLYSLPEPTTMGLVLLGAGLAFRNRK